MDIVFTKQDSVLVAEVSGRVDAVTSSELEKSLLSEIDKGEHRILINLKDVEYVSSAGLRVFLLIAKKLNTLKGKLAFCGLQKMIEDVFKVSGFFTLFNISTTEEDALRGF